jgi:tetratricopeptide (TPR) repeat protein
MISKAHGIYRASIEKWICAVLILATFAAYLPTFHNGLVFDDNQYLVNNRHVTTGVSAENFKWAWTSGYASNWHPLTWITLQLDTQLYGLSNPWGYHLTNLLLHIANTLLLFSILRRSTGENWESGMVAALFALHPLHVESVAWAAERKDVLSTLFGFLAIWFYLDYAAQPTVRRYLPVAAALALSLLAKPMLVTLPFLLLLIDYWPLQRVAEMRSEWRGEPRLAARPSSFVRALFEKLPLLVLSFACSIATVIAQHGTVQTLEKLPLMHRVSNAVWSYLAYLGQMFWPAKLTVFYPLAPDGLPLWQPIVAALVLAMITVLVVSQGGRRPYLLVGWLWYLGTLVPVIGLVQVGIQARADRYTYVPLVGIFVMIAWGVPELVDRLGLRRRILLPIAGLLLAGCSVATWIQVGYWRDALTLWAHAVEVTPDNAIAHNNVGEPLSNEGRLAEAEQHFADAAQIDPHYTEAWYNLGVTREKQGKLDEAARAFSSVLKEKPEDADAHFHLGLIAVRRQRFAEAVPQFAELVRLNPGQASAHNQLGLAYVLVGRIGDAGDCFRRATSLQPAVGEYCANLAFVLHEQMRPAEAKAAYGKAFELDPNWANAALRNAWSSATHPQAAQRNGPLALFLAKKACYALGDSNPECLDVLAAAYAEVGNFDQAASTAKQALALASGARSSVSPQLIEARIQLYESKKPYRQN